MADELFQQLGNKYKLFVDIDDIKSYVRYKYCSKSSRERIRALEGRKISSSELLNLILNDNEFYSFSKAEELKDANIKQTITVYLAKKKKSPVAERLKDPTFYNKIIDEIPASHRSDIATIEDLCDEWIKTAELKLGSTLFL
jgi:hypothetical protein